MSNEKEKKEIAELRHRPKQMRGVETRKLVLEAAAELFEERGYEQTTTHHIAKRAGVSVGAIYRYFADKESIFKEIYRIQISALRDRILSEFSIVDIVSKDVRNLVSKSMKLAFQVFSERPGLRRVLTEQSRKIPDLAEMRRTQAIEIHRTVHQILAAAPGVRMPDTEVGAYLITLFMESLIDDFTLYRREHNKFQEERVISAAIDFILSYALGREPAA